MNLRRSFAAVATAGILVTSSGVAAASADPVRSAPTRGKATPSAQFCERAAPKIIVRLRAHIQRLNGRAAQLNVAKTKALGEGQTELANRLQRRIDHQDRHRSRLQSKAARVQQACNLP